MTSFDSTEKDQESPGSKEGTATTQYFAETTCVEHHRPQHPEEKMEESIGDQQEDKGKEGTKYLTLFDTCNGSK